MKPLYILVFIALFFFPSASSSSGQTTMLQPAPANIRLTEQPDSPVRITLEGVRVKDDGAVWMVQLRVENTSSKGLSAIATVGMSEGEVNGQMMFPTPFRPGRSFMVAATSPKGVVGEREISIDAVIFDDGSIWGPDKHGSSEYLKGIKAGRIRLIQDVSDVLAANDDAALKEFFDRQPYLPEYTQIEKKTKYEEGFVRGYGGELAGLRQILRTDGKPAVVSKLTALKDDFSIK